MKSKFQLAVLFVLAAFIMWGCSTPAGEGKPDLAKTKIDIQAMEDAFSTAEKAKDVDGVAAYYSDDAISYSRNLEPASGIAAIKEHIKQGFAKDTTAVSNVYKVVDLFGEGDMLVEIGSWTVLSAAGEQKDKGHYMSVFKKQADGKYRCIRDMNVTSTPAKS